MRVLVGINVHHLAWVGLLLKLGRQLRLGLPGTSPGNGAIWTTVHRRHLVLADAARIEVVGHVDQTLCSSEAGNLGEDRVSVVELHACRRFYIRLPLPQLVMLHVADALASPAGGLL